MNFIKNFLLFIYDILMLPMYSYIALLFHYIYPLDDYKVKSAFLSNYYIFNLIFIVDTFILFPLLLIYFLTLIS